MLLHQLYTTHPFHGIESHSSLTCSHHYPSHINLFQILTSLPWCPSPTLPLPSREEERNETDIRKGLEHAQVPPSLNSAIFNSLLPMEYFIFWYLPLGSKPAMFSWHQHFPLLEFFWDPLFHRNTLLNSYSQFPIVKCNAFP